ncbi:MAG: hypothetical protein P0Y49_17505 [Candidatus Pedobacter colombiensis]|uniref:Limiting CO2-inducible protein B/C beta carbonyic anhydrase domain-containing protein n=1 Tax=Candidatus Pedobacter colombiensis TaxID=3121371 RepID=A0AAJ6B681_9SPHI|nr:hypothetical protein [Pedobacter sp.]WEK18589.1 MAG: hypothetical protein P0Y49_17505 [Pedobacter sp.]
MDKEYLNTVRKFYPTAKATEDAIDTLLDVVEKKLGLKAGQLMYADSICCDDVNIIQYPARAYEMLGPFKMGGLSGFPFAGITGMNAFANHVPESGAVVIFYAPHIGITEDGVLGEIHRIGQQTNSACCGAASAALSKLMKNEILQDDITALDYQMNAIEQIFLRNAARIKAEENPLFEATEVMYEAIEQRINILISRTNYPCKHIIIAGGIFINADQEMGSYCAYKRFEHLNLETNQSEDWMKDF